MAVTLENPYAREPGREYVWLKGNLHTHTDRSDGLRPTQALVDSYAGKGYQFLAITDHDVFSDYTGVDVRGLILLPGIEVSALDVTLGNGVQTLGSHVLQIGGSPGPRAGEQEVIDRVNGQGGFAVLNHPGRTSTWDHYTMDILNSLQGYLGMEILNGAGIDTDGSAFAVDKWDRVLSTGRRVWGFANDDAHRPPHDGRAWNVVQVGKEERNAAGLMAAFKAGSFYASSGVTIDAIEVHGGELLIRSREAEAIEIYAERGVRVADAEGGEIRVDVSKGLMDVMARNVKTRFIRAQLYGKGTRMAWTQPFFLLACSGVNTTT